MKGAELKTIIMKLGFRQVEVAKKLGESQANFGSMLNAADVKSSLIERISAALGVPISQIYGEASTSIATAAGDGSTAIAGDSNSVNEGKYLELLAEKDKQITTLLEIIKSLSK